MAIEPDLQWTVNPINLLWSIGGALIAGSTLIWGWGRKWQSVESLSVQLTKEIKDIHKDHQRTSDTLNASIARLNAELDILKDEKAKYRIEIARMYVTRDELSKLADLVGELRERIPRPRVAVQAADIK